MSSTRIVDGLTDEPYRPPRWTIDLSLPPRDRYRKLARHYKDRIQGLTGLFDALLRDVAVPEKWIPGINRASKLLLRRVYEHDQTEELKGIAEESGIQMYLLVAFNVILDVLMGCTSGGVRSLEKGQAASQSKMLHFRTLDWTMDPLRQIVVQLDFVRSKSSEPEKILASSITYVGFVGVLTGVRTGLSMSLNFRGVHDNSSRMAQFRFYLHHVLVLLGRRPSIATYLRKYLIDDLETLEASSRRRWKFHDTSRGNPDNPRTLRLADVNQDLAKRHTTAAYLIFCDGDTTISIDKDFRTMKTRQSKEFIATTNHDVLDHGVQQKETGIVPGANRVTARRIAGMDDFLDESEDRLKCISDRWKRLETRQRGENNKSIDARTIPALSQRRLIEWVSKYPTTNETTHYTTVMDPTAGSIIWCTAYPQPLE